MPLPRAKSRLPLVEHGLFAQLPAPVPGLRVMTIASSSSGNAIFVQAGESALLVDAGVSLSRIRAALTTHGVSLTHLRWVLVTHAHSDHCSGLATLLRRTPAEVVATPATLRALRAKIELAAPTRELPLRQPLLLGELDVVAVPTKHDAPGSVALQVAAGGRRLAVITDLGVATPDIAELVAAAHIAIVESNHCVARLHAGRYPAATKKRILSDRGHLSNDAAAALVARHGSPHLARVICAHLSRENNVPALAEATMRSALASVEHLRDCDVVVADPAVPSPLYEV